MKSGCGAGQFYVKADTGSGAMVVSESQGYGMLILPMMAGHDPQAQDIFDGLLNYYRAHKSHIDPRLMSAAQDYKCRDMDGDDSATDGDLDAAYGLILAHLQWGSGGATDYLAAAQKVLGGIYASNVNPETRLVNLGDWVTVSGQKYRYATRSSDWMPGHLAGFAEVESRWEAVRDAHLDIIETMQTNFSDGTGLLPDFVVNANASPQPAPPKFLEAKTDGKYSYNACRDPWRIGVFAVTAGNGRAAIAARKLNAWIHGATDGKPGRIRAGYALNGKPLVRYADLSFTAPFMVSAMTGSGAADQKWLDAMWDEVVETRPEGYYPDTLKLLSMLTASRNWLRP